MRAVKLLILVAVLVFPVAVSASEPTANLNVNWGADSAEIRFGLDYPAGTEIDSFPTDELGFDFPNGISFSPNRGQATCRAFGYRDSDGSHLGPIYTRMSYSSEQLRSECRSQVAATGTVTLATDFDSSKTVELEATLIAATENQGPTSEDFPPFFYLYLYSPDFVPGKVIIPEGCQEWFGGCPYEQPTEPGYSSVRLVKAEGGELAFPLDLNLQYDFGYGSALKSLTLDLRRPFYSRNCSGKTSLYSVGYKLGAGIEPNNFGQWSYASTSDRAQLESFVCSRTNSQGKPHLTLTSAHKARPGQKVKVRFRISQAKPARKFKVCLKAARGKRCRLVKTNRLGTKQGSFRISVPKQAKRLQLTATATDLKTGKKLIAKSKVQIVR